MKLISFRGEMWRSSDLTYVGVVDEEMWGKIQDCINNGHELYFGEVAGKHSEVIWTLEEKEITVLTKDENEIALFKKWFPNGQVGSIYLPECVDRFYEENDDE